MTFIKTDLELRSIHRNNIELYLEPFSRRHTAKYSEWMRDTEILANTCTEEMSLEDVQESQLRLDEDPDSLVLIVNARKISSDEDNADKHWEMIGDVSIFKHEYLSETEDIKCAEISIMIGERSWRRLGIASKCVEMLIEYCSNHSFGIDRYVVKIIPSNLSSIRMFENLNFIKPSETPNEFGEILLFRPHA